MRKKKKIAVLVSEIIGPFQINVVKGITDIIRTRGDQAVLYTGGCVDIPHSYGKYRNFIYDLIIPEKFDGIILMAGVVCTFLTPEETEAFCRRYRGMPLITTSINVKGIPCVRSENTSGMKDLMEHLILGHGYRKFAFISGPRGQKEADERTAVYREALDRHGLPFREECVFEGVFWYQSGKEAVKYFLEENNFDIDVIVAANDQMAIGAVEELHSMKLNIPGDIALTGFDNIKESTMLLPPLTTVNQQTEVLGRKAAEMLYEMISGEDIPGLSLVQTRTVLRQSCGCHSEFISRSYTSEIRHLAENPEQEVLSVPERIGYVLKTSRCNFLKDWGYNWLQSLSESFYRDLENGSEDFFLTILNDQIYGRIVEGKTLFCTPDLMEYLRNLFLFFYPSPENRNRIERILNKAHILIGGILSQSREAEIISNNRFTEQQRKLSQLIMTQFDLETQLNTLADNLDDFNVKGCYIAFFEHEEGQDGGSPLLPSGRARLTMAVNSRYGLRYINTEGPVYDVVDILPREFYPEDSSHLIVDGLTYFEDKLGLVVYDTDMVHIPSQDMLQDLIGSAMKSTTQFHEYRNSLEKQKKLDDLKNDFIANISHDFRSPLAGIIKTSELLSQNDPGLDDISTKCINLIHSTGLALTRKIETLMGIAKMDSQGLEIQMSTVSLTHLFDSILEFYTPFTMGKAVAIHCNYRACNSVCIDSDSGKLEEIFHNILSNAVKFIPDGEGQIRIDIEEHPDSVSVVIGDNGIGIPPDQLDSIFKRFEQVRHRHISEYGGSGIGLAYAWQLVNLLGGRIFAESEGDGKGSVFTVELPKQTDMIRS